MVIVLRVGYVRVSDERGRQNTARQDTIMQQLNVEKVYTDKASGKDTKRPQLQEMLNFVREGDAVVVESISRLARSTADLLNIVKTLADKGVEFVSQKESIDTSTPQGKFMLTVFAALSELEREVTAQRRDEGIAAAKARGVYKGRVPIPVDWDKFGKLYARWKAGELTAVAVQRELGLGARTFYRKVSEYEATLCT